MRVTWRTLLDPVHFLAFGFGSGLAPRAPGTVGSLVGVLIAWALAPLALSWRVAIAALGIALGIWILLFIVTRYVSVASLAAAVALPTAVWLTQSNLFLGIVTTALGALAIYKHKANIQRLRAGTENRIQFRKETPPQ